MDKYEKLKNQVLDECKWCIDEINENHAFGQQIPEAITLVDYIGGPYDFLTDYEKGMLFAYLSLKSTVTGIEEDGAL